MNAILPETLAQPVPQPIRLCETCRWWVTWRNQLPTHSGARLVVGECRHKSPYVIQRPEPATGEMRPVTKWPSTKSTDYCGCHAPAPAAPEADLDGGAS